jgi:hypothetical protein
VPIDPQTESFPERRVYDIVRHGEPRQRVLASDCFKALRSAIGHLTPKWGRCRGSLEDEPLAHPAGSVERLFLIVIDMTVLHTPLPTLTRDLGTSASKKLWIINTYALVVAGLLPGCGTLVDRVGHKRMFVAGLGIFGLASLIAAYSPSPLLLIGARALIAVGAASMMPATLSILRLTFSDGRERALAIGLWSAVASGGAPIGP